MSGPQLIAQSPDVAPPPPTTDTSPEDNAASLRAAALLTLKSRKRKQPSYAEYTLPPRSLAAPPAIQLDYGSAEPSGASSIASSPAIKPVAFTVPVPDSMDVDDSQAREEGEISDSEMSPPSPTPQAKPEPTSPKPIEQDQPAISMPPPPLPKTEPVSPSLSSAPAATIISSSRTVAPASVDANYCRPGLAMTESQYMDARDATLDVLGWGVPPEYLVNCGISRELIYYIFAEHNLRLPENLDVTGLPPIAPRSVATSSASRPIQSTSVSSKSQVQGESSSLSASATPFVPCTAVTTVSAPSSPSLHDMEQQRKQELLARKAAMASRKQKQQASTSGVDATSNSSRAIPPASPRRNSNSSKPVHTKTVDDFLNSIEKAGSSKNAADKSSTNANPSSTTYLADSMDIDEIPGLTGSYNLTTDYTPNPRPIPPRSATISTLTSPKSPAAPPSAVSTSSDRSSYKPLSTSNGNSSIPYGVPEDDDSIPGLFQARSPPVDGPSTNVRRGTKRPVAADFDDMDPGPSRTQSRGEHYRVIPIRRNTGFAGLSQRRCVIELSDTEDEHEDGILYSNGVPSRTESRGPQANSTPQTSAVPTPRINSPGAPSLAAPAALLEKEEQIRRMRELIAQREQDRLRKIVTMSRSTPSSGAVSNGVVVIKQEEDDSAPPFRDSSSSTPDSSATVHPSDSPEEQSVVAVLLPPVELNGDAVVSVAEPDMTSDATTPIDTLTTILEHPMTGDQVLTDEAQQEQVAITSEDHDNHIDSMEVDVIGSHPETSAQVANRYDDDHHMEERQQQSENTAPVFETYRSLLDRHPLLRARSRQETCDLVLSAASASALNGSSSTALVSDIDLKPLKQAAVLKYLSDNNHPVCQYELPGGGECRDKNCENVHLSRLSAVEPSDEETAKYLRSSIPGNQRYSVEVFQKALDVARLSHPKASLDVRVQAALSRLGLR